MDKFGFSVDADTKFVDIHGREIPPYVVGPENKIVFALSDLKQTGVAIFPRIQHDRLATMEKDFGPEFYDFMLESAKSYMLANKIGFSEHQIMNSIESCKNNVEGIKALKAQTLEENILEGIKALKVQTPEENILIKDRVIESVSDADNIVIQISNSLKSPSPSKPQLAPSPQKNYTKLSDLQFPKKGMLSPKTPKGENTQSFNGSLDLTTPKLRLPRKTNFYNVDLKEHDVMVTSIDKPNCVWVRDVANEALCKEVSQKVNDEAEWQKDAQKPWVMDKVYMTKAVDSWYRCRVLRYCPLTVFFLDYGTTSEVDELKNVSEQLAKIPSLALRITFKEPHYTPRLANTIRIKIFKKNADGTLFVNILKGTTPKTPILKGATSEQNTPFKDDDSWNSADDEEVVNEAEFFKKPQFLSKLENNQKVAICCLNNDVFFLRTREGFNKLNEIEKDIAQYVASAKVVKKAKIDQIVLFQDKNAQLFYRAVVKRVDKHKADIELLDYVRNERVNLNLLNTINEKLSKEAITYVEGGKLIGFENKTLNEKQKKFVEEYITSRRKFTTVLGFDDELDLRSNGESLSEELEKLAKGIYLKDIKTFKPEIGLNSYICGSYKNSREFAIVPSDEYLKHANNVVMPNLDDKIPYIPVIGEICLCWYIDHWYRCVVIRVCAKDCEVLLLDFGNMEFIEKENIRKPQENITDIPALAIPCVLVGLPICDNVEELLTEFIREGEIYNVEVNKIQNGKCEVEIPSVYKKINNSL